MGESVAESWLAWIRLFFVRLFWVTRATTPLEWDQHNAIVDLNDRVQYLEKTLSESRVEIALKEKDHATAIEKLNTELEVKREEIDLVAALHTRTVLKIQAETAAYAARIPPEAKQ